MKGVRRLTEAANEYADAWQKRLPDGSDPTGRLARAHDELMSAAKAYGNATRPHRGEQMRLLPS